MAGIDLKRFVDVNIQSKVTSGVTSTRDTVVLFTPDGTANTQRTVTSWTLAQTWYSASATTLAYLKVFFDNGGVKCLVIEGKNTVELDDISALDNKYIVCAVASAAKDVETTYANTKKLCEDYHKQSSVYGINEKIFVARSNISLTGNDDTLDSTSVKNFGVKYSSVLGAEMAMAAYLCRINVDKENTVFDYMFTPESITAESNLTDAEFGSLITYNYNVDIRLANAVRNMGGNCKDGADFTNNYVRIVLHQTLTDSLVNLLSQKIKGTSGISQIYSAIAQNLENYRLCGYLTTDKIWTYDDLDVIRNGQTYNVIKKGDALVNGYIIKVLPMSALTENEKLKRSAPPVYVVLADQYGIRKITISGEVI